VDTATQQEHDGDAMTGWIAVGVALVVFAIGAVVLFRSFRRWKQAPSGDPVAESELWSTRNMGQR